MQKPPIYTVNQAIKKLEYYCSYQERCHKEVEQKLDKMNMISLAKEKIILHLLEQNFLNEERFAKAFARGKFRIKNWGKQRIIRELKYKGISTFNIDSALTEIPEETYLIAFNTISEKKFKSINESNLFKKKKKLIDYLLYYGWEKHLVYNKVAQLIKANKKRSSKK